MKLQQLRYLTEIARWQEVGEAHGEVFGQIRPATTLVEVARLIDDAALIEPRIGVGRNFLIPAAVSQ